MTPFDRQLRAAEGFLELGLPREAAEELDAVAASHSTRAEVLGLRVQVCRVLGQWEPMAAAAETLCRLDSGNPQWPISLAYAMRRAHSLGRAKSILLEAVGRFPQEAILHYNLACYEAQLGCLEPARERLREAIRLVPAWREMAAADADLEPLGGLGF